MKKITFIILSLNLMFVGCAEAQETTNKQGEVKQTEQAVAKDVSAEEFKTLIDQEGTILDVRTPGEFSGGHLPSAVNVSFYDANFDKLIAEKVDKTKPVYVYCAAGGRSAGAMKKMKKMGYNVIYNMVGGYSGWSSKGYPTEK